MNGMRKIFGLVVATLMFAAFALPASAAKLYSLDITLPNTVAGISLKVYTVPPVPQGGGAAVNVPVSGGQVYATIVNQTPTGGNSAINSLTFTKPPGWTISLPVGPSGVTLDISTGNLKVSNFPSLLPKDSQGAHGITVGFTLKPDTCTTGSLTWVPSPQYVTVHTGNFSPTTFAFVKDSASGTLGTNQTTNNSGCISVTFDANGGTGTMAIQTSNYGVAANLTANAFGRTGYTFAGWNTLANGTGTSYANGASYPFTASVTLYAQWTPNPITVQFDANGGTTGTMLDQTRNYGSAASLTTNAFGRTGYTFANWNTLANGTGTSYANGASYAFTASVTLYAQWTPNPITVHFDANGGTGTMLDQTRDYGSAASLTANAFTRTGNTFAGWNTQADGLGTSYANGVSYPFTASVTLYAKWTINPITVHFDANGGTGTMLDQTRDYGSAASLTANAFTRTNYTFAGWTTLANGTGTSYANGVSYPFTASVTLYAQWTANTLTITDKPTSVAVPPLPAAPPAPFVVTVSSSPGSVTITPDTSACGGVTTTWTFVVSGNSTTFTFTIPSGSTSIGASCTISFSALNYGPASTSPPLPVYKGVLDCGQYDSILGSSNHLYDPDLPSTLSGQGSTYVGLPGWGLRRGPNRDGSATCVKVNYTCNMDTSVDPAIASCTWDKNVMNFAGTGPEQATFKYLFLWPQKAPDANGWTSYRPQVSWNMASPTVATTLPDWVPLLACLSDLFPLTGVPTTILPTIPSVTPFTDAANFLINGGHAWYQPGQTALVCGGQQGWTAVGGPGNPLLQIWNIIIDEADLQVRGP